MGKRDGQYAAGMGDPGLGFLAGLHVPQLDGPVFAGAGEEIGIVAEGDGRDAGLVPGEIVKLVAALGFPHPHAAGAIGAGEHDAIAAIGDGGYPIGVLFRDVDERAVAHRNRF